MGPRPSRRVQTFVFLAAWISFAYFHSGGGWNQNGRFAQIRALVEESRFAIDSFAVYRRAGADVSRLQRAHVDDGEVSIDGTLYALAWSDGSPIAGPPHRRATLPTIDLNSVAVSGDLSAFDGHLYPNKAPGTTFLAAPAYFLIHLFDRLAGFDGDRWWTLTVNAWLTSALSVGALSALGCVLFLRAATPLCDWHAMPALLATGAFAWGTLFFPYATWLYEHNVVAVAFLAAFCLLLEASLANDRESRSSGPFYAGVCAGFGVAANYIGLPAVALLGAYGFHRLGARAMLRFALGLVPAFAAIGWYDLACFGGLWKVSYTSENPAFRGSDLFLGVFELPRLGVLAAILFSPFRGLFYTSPLLLAGVAGWVVLFRSERWRAEALLFIGVLLVFVIFNASFHYWEGGWSAGPRYLVPAVPFVALPLAVAFDRFRVATSILAVVSIAIMILVTAVDPQAPVLLRNPLWRYDPLFDYELPLFLGNPSPIVAAETESDLILYSRTIGRSGVADERQQRLIERARLDLATAWARRDVKLFPASTRPGPVSANPIGIYEPDPYRLFPPGSEASDWNAFNAGELVAPKSRWSLLPMLVVSGTLLLFAVRATRHPLPSV